MTACILAIDGGSQSTKVSLIDLDGQLLASAQVPLRPYALGPGGTAVHPDDDLWTTLTQACREVLHEASGLDVVAIGLCGIRFCRALLDEDHRLVEPVWSWMDARVGQPHELDDWTASVVSAGGYLAARLTGELRDSSASYQGMWPIDPVTGRWSDDPQDFDRTGMPRHVLPTLVDPGGLLGSVTEAAARETGLPAGVRVYATGNDKAVEALGCGLLDGGLGNGELGDGGELLLSLGTYIAAMAVTGVSSQGASFDDPEGRFWVNAAAVPGQRLVESRGIRRGMWTVAWLRDLVGSAADQPREDAEVLRWLEDGAADLPAGSDGLITLPDWLAPADAPERRGAFLGFDGSHGPHHLYRSVLEGIVLTMHDHVEEMEQALGIRHRRLVVSGGGSQSDLMTQIVADVFDRPVERSAVPDAAGLGSAICAAVGHGMHGSFPNAVAAMTRRTPAITARPELADDYRRLRPTYRATRELMDPVWRLLADAGS